MKESIWTAVMILIAVIAAWYINRRKEIKEAKQQSSDIVNLQGVKINRQQVKCPVELCRYRKDGCCTNEMVDLCMLVKNNYDEYGLYCKCFESVSVVDVGV